MRRRSRSPDARSRRKRRTRRRGTSSVPARLRITWPSRGLRWCSSGLPRLARPGVSSTCWSVTARTKTRWYGSTWSFSDRKPRNLPTNSSGPSDDRTARLWDARTLAPIGEPLDHQALVLSASFSPDGTRLVTGSEDGTARLWDVSIGLNADASVLAELAQAIAGYTINAARAPVPIPPPKTSSLALPTSAAEPPSPRPIPKPGTSSAGTSPTPGPAPCRPRSRSPSPNTSSAFSPKATKRPAMSSSAPSRAIRCCAARRLEPPRQRLPALLPEAIPLL